MFFSKTTSATATPVNVITMKNVQSYIEVNGPSYLLQAIRTLQSHLRHADLADVPARLDWFDENFPKPKRGVHPRPDLPQKLVPYKKWLADIRRCVSIATGMVAERELRRSRDDSWRLLLDAFEFHCNDGGLVHRAALSPLKKLADVCRAAGIESYELSDEFPIERLEAAIIVAPDRPIIRAGLELLSKFSFIHEIAEHLPSTGSVIQIPSSRDLMKLPEHVELVIAEMAERAASKEDKVARRDARVVTKGTSDRYQTALRYHFRTLLQCTKDDAIEHGFEPITDLCAVNDVRALLSYDHLCATLCASERQSLDHPERRNETIACYYSDLFVVLFRNGLLTGDQIEDIKSSRFLRKSSIRNQTMTPETRAWCEKLLSDPLTERRFRNLHRTSMALAKGILTEAQTAGRELTTRELARVRNLGVVAAACAIEYAGRPIRLSNVLQLRLHGERANFFLPGREHKTYRFELLADETKARKEEAMTELNVKMGGKDVLDWYLSEIRPLFPTSARSHFLFTSVTDPKKHMPKAVFDGAFQRAASELDIPMTFHKWRHGYASLLLRENWGNLALAADMLGNTPNVCSKNYIFINKKEMIQAGQKIMLESARKLA